MSQLGRISGPLLDANLNRLGVDLTFRNHPVSEDLLYLKVTNNTIGVNKEPASYSLEVDGTTHTTNLIADTNARLANILIENNTFSTYTVANINITPNQSNPLVLMDQLRGGNLNFKDTTISNYTVNGNIRFDPNGGGIVDIYSNTTVNGNLTVTGNTQINGNLTEAENIILGATGLPIETVTIVPDFSQSIVPGDDLTYDLGTGSNRWKHVYARENLDIGTLSYNDLTIGLQLQIESSLPSISTLQSNDNVNLLPDTGNTDIERFRFNGDTITNLDETVGTLASTGIGYTRFIGSNGVVIPAGTNSERAGFPSTPEIGATRWNTEDPLNEYLECFDGTVWASSTGGGTTVSLEDMEDLGNVYILILG
jgi:hypothetical protein